MFQIVDNKVSEEQLLFRSDNDADLYGMLYHARGEEKGAIVLCPPEGDERTWSQRVLVNTSRLLATHGHTVLRFDYMGQGESDGEYEDSTLSSRLVDVESAIGFLMKRTQRSQIGLMGLRLGGTLASLVASKNLAVKSLILWEPVVDLPTYLYNLLRVNISFQMVMHKAVLKNREKLVEEILSGGRVGINGFYLTKGFFQEAMETKLDGILQKYNGQRLIVVLPGSNLPMEDDGTVLRLEFPVFWKEPKVYRARSKILMEETLKWVTQNGV